MTLETPIVVGEITLANWIEGHTYEDSLGRTYYSGAAEPSLEDAEDCIANPRTLPTSPTEAQVWDAWLAGYITDATTGFELKTSISACNRFSAMETLLKSGLEHGAITGASEVSVWDRHNVEHVLPVTDCRALLLRYGFAWQAGFNAYAP